MSRFFTNEEENTLLNKFAGVFSANKDIVRFDALVGYLRSSGYFSVRPHLEKVPKVRILVGINVDEIVESYHRKGHLFLVDATSSIEKFKSALSEDIARAKYSQEVEKGITTFVEDVVSGKLEIKAHPTRNLHAKIYLFIPEGFSEHKAGSVITGSSNLTDAGLGTKDRASNYEFNVLLHDYNDVQFASAEFERLWGEGITILPKEITEIKAKSFLRDDITPFQLYIKLLIEHFGAAIDYDPNSETDLPEGFMRLAYQMDAVSQGFQLLKKHRGFFLSDVVGLGKTVIAILIAKKFFYHNGFPNHISSTLIIVPPALEENWKNYQRKFELKGVDIVTSGSLHKVHDPERYDLIIVDEAHRFRSDNSQGYEALQKLCKTPTRHRLSDDSRAEKRVILISATPLNNKPEDIRNLLLLFQDGRDSSLEIANLTRFFANHQKDYDKAIRSPDKAAGIAEVKRIYEEIRTRVLEEITIRRTRTDLEKTEEYRADLDRQGIRFPKINAPRKIFYILDPVTEQLYDDTVTALHSGLKYDRYQAIGYLVPTLKAKYPHAGLVSTQLARIMKVMLLKRLDSSFYAFRKSLSRFHAATGAMIKMFEAGRIFIAPDENVTEFILEGREEELLERLTDQAIRDGTTPGIYKPCDFEPKFLPSLRKDLAILDDLLQRWERVTTDPKLDVFIAHLRGVFVDKKLNPTGKLVVFSEAQDTTNYLKEKLLAAGFGRLLTVSASNRKEAMPSIRANFDANEPAADQKDDIDLLISTEVLGEGVNLHRANVIVNYDTPWNSTRLMQRLGRVNRIGSTAPELHIYNFFPTAKVDAQIDLQQRALIKLQAFHQALGEDSQIYSPEEEIDTFGLFDRTFEEERDERLEYLDELRRFKRENLAEFKTIKNLPLRIRVSRKDHDRAGSTISYVKNARRDSFHRIRNGEEGLSTEELSFIEAARIFRATIKERSVELPDFHHEHVSASVEEFRQQLIAESVQNQRAHVVTPDEKQAMRILEALQNLPPNLSGILSPEDREMLKAGAEAIRIGKFDPMRTKLVRIAKAQNKTPLAPADLLDKTLAVLRDFPLVTESDPAREQRLAGFAYSQLLPDIILSESFIA